MLSGDQIGVIATVLGHAIPMAHISGGILLIIGLLTRLAALVQIPILCGAVMFVHLEGGAFMLNQGFEFAALVLFLLILIFIYGSGPWSLDQYLETHKST